MSNKKITAVQELILEFKELKKTKLYETSFKAIDDCINLAITKLELEKEQIKDAYIEGAGGSVYAYKEFAEEYVEDTYDK